MPHPEQPVPAPDQLAAEPPAIDAAIDPLQAQHVEQAPLQEAAVVDQDVVRRMGLHVIDMSGPNHSDPSAHPGLEQDARTQGPHQPAA